MAEEYNIQAIINDLKEKEEMDPDKHDGCYELMRETISAYAKLDDFSVLDYKDLNLVYLTTVGTWKQKIESKKKTVNDSHLMPNDKEHLSMLWDEVWEKAGRGEYTNFELDAAGGRSVGLFGTGFFSFQRTTTNAHAQAFIRMCVDMLPMTEDEEMFGRAAQTLTVSFQGMRAASASMVLHCLKPFSFPILNANTGFKNIFEVLGVQLVKPGNIETYIDNSRRIKSFRDKNFTCKNYRIYDIESQNLDGFRLKHEYGKIGPWEIVDEDTARLTCDKGMLQIHSVIVPQEICWFFNATGLHSGIKQEIVFSYDGYEYDGYVEKTVVSPAKTSVFWNDALTEEFEEYTEDGLQHVLEFRRDGDDRFRLNFVESEAGGRAWLITWNKNNWYWQNFEKKCEATKKGETFVESWACSNSNPKTGDEVFLIKLGDQPRGIIGHGTVARPIYETAHFDATKAAEGKKQKSIGVRFDRLINYEKDRFIEQSELAEKCPAQYWSPQSSGIEIKQEVIPTLHELWETVTRTDDKGDPKPSQEYNEGGKDEMSGVRFDHNMILYGPPGTGKTYNSVNYAVAICEGRPVEEVGRENYPDVLKRYNALRREGRILFTTFHQSYGYEEFIEGIRPVMASDENSGGLDYEITDGIFKTICNAARTPEGTAVDHNASLWFVRLKDSGDNDLKRECFDNGEIRFEGPENPADGFSWEYERLSKMKPGDYVLSYGGKSVYVDGIGVVEDDGPVYDQEKTSYRWTRKVKWLVKNTLIDVKEINGNHYLPNYKITAVNHMKLSDLLRVVEQNGGHGLYENDKSYVIIIDEINRGNVSKIFGELITLIEETKREGAAEAMEAVLPYSGESFSVPDNVYIIGTMNTADRSIALMDTALRRRFEFVEMMPEPEVLESLGVGTILVEGEELNVARMLAVINERIEYLFDREHTIGHAFFTRLKDDPSIETLAGIFEKNVIPLLQEYFYEDYEKIQLVLGDNDKEDEFKFVLDKKVELKQIFKGNPDIDLPPKGYSIQRSAFRKLQSYKLIGKEL